MIREYYKGRCYEDGETSIIASFRIIYFFQSKRLLFRYRCADHLLGKDIHDSGIGIIYGFSGYIPMKDIALILPVDILDLITGANK